MTVLFVQSINWKSPQIGFQTSGIFVELRSTGGILPSQRGPWELGRNRAVSPNLKLQWQGSPPGTGAQ
jgi:hypothetical protein